MKFSLVLCTVDRKKEVINFFDSLERQKFKNFEIIIVDQNLDNKILDIIKLYPNLVITYLRSKRGLSRARNLGLEHAKGEIICFPDDDCEYPEFLLENINSFFCNYSYDILMGKTIDKITGSIVAGKNILKPQILDPLNILGSSTTLFIKKELNVKFDEHFGIGSTFNSEEENDLVFRLLKIGFRGYYEPNINIVYHPPSDLDYTNITRAKLRAIGLGAFIAKHFFSKDGIIYFIKYNLFRPLVGVIVYFLKFDTIKSKFYFYRFLGIWTGFIKYIKLKIETSI